MSNILDCVGGDKNVPEVRIIYCNGAYTRLRWTEPPEYLNRHCNYSSWIVPGTLDVAG